MRAYIEGISKLDFKDDNGQRVKGFRAYYQYKDPDCIGLASDKFFIRHGTDVYSFVSSLVTELFQSNNLLSGGLAIPVSLDFNNKGKLLFVTFLDDSGMPMGEPLAVKKGGVISYDDNEVNDDES